MALFPDIRPLVQPGAPPRLNRVGYEIRLKTSSGVHVFLLQAADSTVLVSDVADLNGNFALKLPTDTAPLLLKTTCLGYADRYTVIEGSSPLEIEMQLSWTRPIRIPIPDLRIPNFC